MSIGRPCSICTHAERSAIERAVLSRVPFRAISRQYGMHAESVHRHVETHMSINLEGGIDTRQSLLANLAYLSSQTLEILDMAREKQSMVAAAALIGAAQKNIELLAKLTGELNERPQVNILVLPQWQRVEDALMGALLPYPQAMEAVRGALSSIES